MASECVCVANGLEILKWCETWCMPNVCSVSTATTTQKLRGKTRKKYETWKEKEEKRVKQTADRWQWELFIIFCLREIFSFFFQSFSCYFAFESFRQRIFVVYFTYWIYSRRIRHKLISHRNLFPGTWLSRWPRCDTYTRIAYQSFGYCSFSMRNENTFRYELRERFHTVQ